MSILQSHLNIWWHLLCNCMLLICFFIIIDSVFLCRWLWLEGSSLCDAPTSALLNPYTAEPDWCCETAEISFFSCQVCRRPVKFFLSVQLRLLSIVVRQGSTKFYINFYLSWPTLFAAFPQYLYFDGSILPLSDQWKPMSYQCLKS